MRLKDLPPAPADLSAEAQALWTELVAKKDIHRFTGKQQILNEALRAHDLERDCKTRIEADGLTMSDKFGQSKVHPLLATLRDARAQKLAAFKMLRLHEGEIEPIKF